MYESLSDIMRDCTDGKMLNFGYWGGDVTKPIEAQHRLCTKFGEFSKLAAHQKVMDVGSGYGAPALQWNTEHRPIDIFSLNISMKQLAQSPRHIPQINATSVHLPFQDSSLDRVIAFESAQHFKPLARFCAESFRILANGGVFAMAIPVMADQTGRPMKMGLVSLTWSSEHYTEEHVIACMQKNEFVKCDVQRIGCMVYPPLGRYYLKNRPSLKKIIDEKYPAYVEPILYRSMRKMIALSEKGIIEYLLVRAVKPA